MGGGRGVKTNQTKRNYKKSSNYFFLFLVTAATLY